MKNGALPQLEGYLLCQEGYFISGATPKDPLSLLRYNCHDMLSMSEWIDS
jgi:hypothetical protein